MRQWGWLLLVVAGCGAPLPDPESPGAQVLQRRCAGCHNVPPPGSMTPAMWQTQLERMRALFAQRGMPWLTADEDAALQAYLGTHAGRQ